jgi:hypothetical protein
MKDAEKQHDEFKLLKNFSFVTLLNPKEVSKVISYYDHLKESGRIIRQENDSDDKLIYLFSLFFEKHLSFQKISDITWYLPELWPVKNRLKALYLSYDVNNIVTDYEINLKRAIPILIEALTDDFVLKSEINRALALSNLVYFLLKGTKELDQRGLIPLREKILREFFFDKRIMENFSPTILCEITALIPDLSARINIDSLSEINNFLAESFKEYKILKGDYFSNI